MELPTGTLLQKISASYNENTIPRELLNSRVLEPELWARLVVETGEMLLYTGSGSQGETLTPQVPGIIRGGQLFRVAPTGKPGCFHLEFHHTPRLNDAEALAASISR